MKKRNFLLIVLCCAMLLSATACKQTPPPTEPTEPTEPHEHVLGDWELGKATGCGEEGREDRRCACGYTESRPIAKTAHEFGDYDICKGCGFVNFDPNADFVELGVACKLWYGKKTLPNVPWDIKLWNGKIYRGAGDYDKNSGGTPIFAYNIATQSWEDPGLTGDEAIHRFVEINGTLYAPGIDPTTSWVWGNYYVLKPDGKWDAIQNIPNGVHNFDMIEYDGKIFVGSGTEAAQNTVGVSEDGGKTYKYLPLYKDGEPMDLYSYRWSRTYEFTIYQGKLYALISMQMGIGSMTALYRYEDGKMVYVRNAYDLVGGISAGRNYWDGKFEFGNACYITAGHLYAITDFSDMEGGKEKIEMPGKENVSDAFLKDGTIYTLCYTELKNPSNHNRVGYTVTIYKSTTGKTGSFTKVLSYDYAGMPISFDYDGNHFYIGMGVADGSNASKSGMVLRVKPGYEGPSMVTGE